MFTLTSLLPGVRDLRAPLGAGYIWLLALYLAFEPTLPTGAEATGVWASLLALKDEIGPAGLGIVLTFIAYLVGSISATVFGVLLESNVIRSTAAAPTPDGSAAGATRQHRLAALVRAFAARTGSTVTVGSRGDAALRDVVRERVAALDNALRRMNMSLREVVDDVTLVRDDPSPLPGVLVGLEPVRELLVLAGEASEERWWEEATEASARRDLRAVLAGAVLAELDLMRTRLLGKEPELFSTVDRLRSEAEFRFALVPALLGLAVALGWRATWWLVAIIAVAAAILGVQGRDQRRRSHDALLEALRIDRAHAPSIDRFQAVVDQLQAQVAQVETSHEIDSAIRVTYERAAERGRPVAARKLGALLERHQDLEGAVKRYRQAEEQGDAEGVLRLADLLARQGAPDAKTVARRAYNLSRWRRIAALTHGGSGAEAEGRSR
jgi:hypothetical protein